VCGEGADEAFEAGDTLLVLGEVGADSALGGAAFETFPNVRADHLAVADAQPFGLGFDAREQVGVEAAGRRQQPGWPFGSGSLERACHIGAT
jgi:hypothetical protein